MISIGFTVGVAWRCGLVLLGLLWVPRGTPGFAQAISCSADLEAAEERYVEGAFEEVIRLASGCVSRPGADLNDAIRAYRLLTLAHLKNGDGSEGRLTVVRLLGVQPRYEPDYVLDPPSYVQLVQEVKEQLGLETGPQPQCAHELIAAEARYIEGDFAQAVQLVAACLNKPELGDEESGRAYRLLALAYLQQGDLKAARTAVVALVRVVPDYQYDPLLDPPAYTALVDIVRQQISAGQ